ncbi:MAG: xanthine dehydrogenase accessory protein XdhC [Oligoflexia bacterium]|nr:xanthine dehydrogenase accessory protein XdhC [Oligoflexia bacterium]
MSDFWSAAARAYEVKGSFIVVTLVSARGHAPQEPGAKAIMTLEGIFWGTVGGGKLEARALDRAQALLRGPAIPNPAPELVQWNLQRDIGMTCGGEVTMLFEIHRRDAWKIVVFGAGHVAQALIRALEPLGCQLVCLDPRAEWLEKLPVTPKLRKVHSAEPGALVESLAEDSFFVVMTQGHSTDLPIITALLKRFPQAPYIGTMGSRIKALKVRAELKELGFSDETIARLRCPIGLPLGTNAPAEIAISVAAELIQARDARHPASS